MQDYFILTNSNKKFKQGTLVKFVTIINEACLVENVNTKEREWIMRYDIYPLENHDFSGFWKYHETYQNMIPKEHFETIKELKKNSYKS
jgi:hypothetical protein